MTNIKQKNNKSSHSVPVHDTPFIPRSGLLHNKIEQLLKILNSQLQDQNKRENREQSLRTKLDLLSVNDRFGDTYQTLSKKLNDCITQGVWKDKEIQRTKKQLNELRKRQGFSKIARAFMTVGEDPTLAKITSSLIQTTSSDNSNNNGDVPPIEDPPTKSSDEFSFDDYVDQEKVELQENLTQMKHDFQELLEVFEKEKEEHRKEQLQNKQERNIFIREQAEMKDYIRISKQLIDTMRSEFQEQLGVQAATIKSFTSNGNSSNDTKPTDENIQHISSPIQKLLNNYDNLDDDSKKSLFQLAMTTTNPVLQKTINLISLQAKLAKELITLAEKYKVPELTFDTKATKRRANYYFWSSKLRPILAMFPQTNKVLYDGNITSFTDPEDIGNKALYLVISAKVDEYFQRAIKKFEGYGDKALSFIKIQCANIGSEDTHHFHHLFSTLRIKDNESATNFF
jgi:hypothetical protein